MVRRTRRGVSETIAGWLVQACFSEILVTTDPAIRPVVKRPACAAISLYRFIVDAHSWVVMSNDAG